MAKKPKANSHRSRRPVHGGTHATKVIKSGAYDGSQSSSDFVVSGHSTGATNTEMEALSHQVSIDAGRVPDYPTDDNYRVQKTVSDFGMAMPEDARDTSDLGGPDLYGPKPDLLKKSAHQPRRMGLLGIAGAAILGIATFAMYKRSKLAPS